MNIRFKELERTEGKKANGEMWEAFLIHGIKLEDNTDWVSSKIFNNPYNEEILGKLETLTEGDEVGIAHKKNKAGYWVVSDITAVKSDPSPAKTGNSGRTGGTGKSSTWNGRTGDAYDRSAAVYLAFDFLKYNKGILTAKAKEMAISEDELFSLAIRIDRYIHTGALPVGGDDGLDAPDVS